MENQCCRSIVETGDGLLINYGDRIVLKRKDGKFELRGAIEASKEYYDAIRIYGNQVYLPPARQGIAFRGGRYGFPFCAPTLPAYTDQGFLYGFKKEPLLAA